jgi:hypothetical protein
LAPKRRVEHRSPRTQCIIIQNCCFERSDLYEAVR